MSVGNSPTPRVVISVLNWNGADRTIQCLEQLQQLDYPDIRIIVVDNGSGDDSVARIRAAFPSLELIVSPENTGYAAGNEIALQRALNTEADTALFWILNNDAIVAPDTLAQLVTAYHRHGDALYGSISLNFDQSQGHGIEEQPVQVTAWALNPDGSVNYQRLLLRRPYREVFSNDEDLPVANLMGNSIMIPLQVVRKHGFMDPDFFLYWEEADYCFRLRNQGLHCYLVPKSRVYHEMKHTDKHDSRLKPVAIYYNARNRILWAKRYLSRTEYWRWVFGEAFFTLKRYAVPLKRGPKAFRIAWYATRAVFDGVRNRSGKTLAPEQFIRNTPSA